MMYRPSLHTEKNPWKTLSLNKDVLRFPSGANRKNSESTFCERRLPSGIHPRPMPSDFPVVMTVPCSGLDAGPISVVRVSCNCTTASFLPSALRLMCRYPSRSFVNLCRLPYGNGCSQIWVGEVNEEDAETNRPLWSGSHKTCVTEPGRGIVLR